MIYYPVHTKSRGNSCFCGFLLQARYIWRVLINLFGALFVSHTQDCMAHDEIIVLLRRYAFM